MKEVEKLLDLTPVLTEELMRLSSWLSDKTLSFKITALQAMLPAALKAKYEKELKVVDEEALTPDIKQLFRNQKVFCTRILPMKAFFRHFRNSFVKEALMSHIKSPKKRIKNDPHDRSGGRQRRTRPARRFIDKAGF